MEWTKSQQQTKLVHSKSWSVFHLHRDLLRSWSGKSNSNSKRDRNYKRYRNYKYILPVILSVVFPVQSYAETVGGVSATAAPVANSSGSVTNQAIQVLQGPYITNTYGGGIQCQGPTVNFTPFLTGSASFQKPYEPYYDSPVYNGVDITGDFDDDGRPKGDGIPDFPGDILYQVPTRTGQKDNYNLSAGFSATWSRPLDKKLQEQCKEAAATQISLQQQITANKRLDFEIARLKNCGELMMRGIQFRPGTRYASICADVLVNNPPGHTHPHVHAIPKAIPSTGPASTNAADLGGPLQSQ